MLLPEKEVLRVQEWAGWEMETMLMLLQRENKSEVQICAS